MKRNTLLILALSAPLALGACSAVTTAVAVGATAVNVDATAVNVTATTARVTVDAAKVGVDATGKVVGWAMDAAKTQPPVTPALESGASVPPPPNQ